MATRKQPKIVGYMAGLYEVMTSQATELVAEGGEGVLIWQGRLIQTCTSVGIPEGYYKKVVDALRRLGSIEIVSRGSRGSNLTAIVLRHPPSEELYEDAIVKSGWSGLTTAVSFDTLVAQVKELQQRLGGLSIVDALKNHEDRVKTLETAVEGLAKEVQKLQQSITDNTNQ